LAKAFEAEVPLTDISQSPTLTEEMTRAGVILGTAAYMSPEQAKGKPVDKRADIFAFGAVLYELLTGKRAFEGETITETIAAVLKSEPDWEKLPSGTPWGIRTLLRRCLQKELNRRLQHIGDVRIEIEEALSEPITGPLTGETGAVQPPLWKRVIPWSITAGAVLVAGLAIWSLTAPTLPTLRRLVVSPPESAPLSDSILNDLAISPDGKHLVYLANTEGTTQLYVRSLDNFEARPIPGTEGATGAPFFSPDGESIGFVAGDQLTRVPLAGGPAFLRTTVSVLLQRRWVPSG